MKHLFYTVSVENKKPSYTLGYTSALYTRMYRGVQSVNESIPDV